MKNIFKMWSLYGIDLEIDTLELNNPEMSGALFDLLKDFSVGAARVAWFLSWRLSCTPHTPHTPPVTLFLPPAPARVRARGEGSSSTGQVQQRRPDVRWARVIRLTSFMIVLTYQYFESHLFS
jgi:hypothetical protein